MWLVERVCVWHDRCLTTANHASQNRKSESERGKTVSQESERDHRNVAAIPRHRRSHPAADSGLVDALRRVIARFVGPDLGAFPAEEVEVSTPSARFRFVTIPATFSPWPGFRAARRSPWEPRAEAIRARR